MSKPGYALLQDVIMDADFPDLDLALRRGRHVDREDAAWYALLHDGQEQLELFYRRYGCELIHKTDGYFYLLPTGDKISRKQLSASDMLVGQALALLYLDPANIERGGVIAHDDLVAQLSGVLGTDALIAAFNPGTGAGKRKKYDERIAQRNVRNRVAESVRRLESMGFVDSTEDERVRLRPALMRFAEPVRGLSEPAEALAKLVAQGEVALEAEEGEELETGEEPAAEGVEAVAEVPEPASDAEAEPTSGVTTRLALEEPALVAAPLDADRGDGELAVADALGVEHAQMEPRALEPAALGAVREAESAAEPPAEAAQPTAAEDVHPMDRDLDWADILPEPEEPG